MRIGLTSHTITEGKMDGIGIYTKTLLEFFLKKNLIVTPVSFSNNLSQFSYTTATLISLLTPFSSLIYQDMTKQLDLLHITDHMIPRVKKIPVIATLHDALMFKHPEWYPSKFRHLKNNLRKETIKWANHFITISHAMVPELVQYLGINEKNISVVYNGIPEHWHHKISHEEKLQILKKLNLPEKFILFTGTLQPKKNIPRLIQAFMDLPQDIREEYPLVIAGKAGWDTEKSLAAIQLLTSTKAGYWLDYVSELEIKTLYQMASLYVFPSLHEGFGLTPLEAFASGTPVVSSYIPAITEVVQDAAFLVDPYSIIDIKNAMHNALTSETWRRNYKEKAYQRVKEFTQEKCARETLKVYEKIASITNPC